MKKINFLILNILLLLFFPISAFATGSISPSTQSITIEQGKTAAFKINANNAVGRVDISSTNESVASIDKRSEWLENNSVTVTVTGNSVGTATINIKLSDAATFDEEELTGTKTVKITVKNKDSSTNSNSSNQNTNNSTSNITKTNNGLSTNNALKSITVEGFELKKIDAKNYELVVSNNVTSIKLDAQAKHEKAKITGLGEKNLKIGLNTFEVTVISESGSKNKINVRITRKDGFYLEDLDNLLKDSSINNLDIIVDNNIILNKEKLLAIKSSNKIVNFNYINEENTIIYSWIIDGNKISNELNINTKITFETNNIEKIKELSNYAEGKYIHYDHSGVLPKGIKSKLYVGDKYEDNKKVNLYYYNEDSKNLELIKNGLVVKNGYIEFDIEHCSDYFVTMSNIGIGAKTSNTSIFMIVSLVESILIIILLVLDYLKINPILKLRK